MQDSLSVRYTLDFPDGKHEVFELAFDPESVALRGEEASDPPAWTALEFEQCPNCPLSTAEHSVCPAAAALGRLVSVVDRIYAHETVDVTVETDSRTISRRDATIQSAVGSLMGLIMATSGCPQLSFFRPMARFHLPFASPEETIYRATSSYLLMVYIARMDGDDLPFDLDGLADVYEEVQTVNRAFADRLRKASEADGAVNSLVSLDILAQVLPMAIEDQLAEIRHVFEPYLESRPALGG